MRDYEEKSYYEIQLDNKQLILVFLAGVTVCVLIFVLGVMVGKGKKEAEMAATGRTEAMASQKTKEDLQPPPEAKPIVESKPDQKAAVKETKPKAEEDYSFYDLDKAESDPKLSKKQGTTTAPAENKPAPKEKAKPEPETAEPVAVSASPAADTTEASVPSGSGRYTVQVMATASKSKAEQQLALLKTKGYTAYMDEEKGSGANVYKVRVGRFADSGSAKLVATKLKEELNLDTWVAVLD